MDGNGRWARARGLPVAAGHRAGVEAIRGLLDASRAAGISAVTLYAFSSENWRRPRPEVRALMALFLRYLRNEVADLHRKGIRVRFIGDRARFSDKLCTLMDSAETLTAQNRSMTLVIAADYGGRWDISNAARLAAAKVRDGELAAEDIDEHTLGRFIALDDLPEVDLMVRTGGDHRISNFLLWQLAYAELYFTECYWPDFNESELKKALEAFANRERRFGGRPAIEGAPA